MYEEKRKKTEEEEEDRRRQKKKEEDRRRKKKTERFAGWVFYDFLPSISFPSLTLAFIHIHGSYYRFFGSSGSFRHVDNYRWL